MCSRHSEPGAGEEYTDRRAYLNDLAIKSRIVTGRRKAYCRTPAGRFMDSVRKAADGCWEWMGTISTSGYGRLSVRSGDRHFLDYAHRLSHRWFKGEIPGGYHVDHLCHNTRCVNPDHLEAVTVRANTYERARGDYFAPYLSGYCRKGHAMTEDNVYLRPDGTGRMCRTCQRDRYERRKTA